MHKTAKAVAIWATVVAVALLIFFSSPKKEDDDNEKLATSQNWLLCWEKKPEYAGITNARHKCLPAVIEKRDNSYIVISYSYPGGKGVQEGVSTDGISYSGKWTDPTGWGNWHLRFISPDAAFGWSDDKGTGDKQPDILKKI